MTDELTPEQRAAQYLSRIGKTSDAPAPEPEPEQYAESIPDVEPYVPTEEDEALDRTLDGIDIVTAYTRWCGKSPVQETGKTESIMISCPNPAHPDTHPSAWLNTEKQVYFCGGCQEGGDKFDIAAWHFGYGVPDYKQPGQFPELKRKMAEDFGFVVRRTPGGSLYVVEPTPDEPERDDAPLASVTQLPTPADLAIEAPSIDWASIVPGDTFLADWMHCTEPESLPDEYFFWNGLQALGFAAGDDAVLADFKPVRGNFFVCLTGPSGIGKSRAIASFLDLIRRAIPYDYTDPDSKGTMLIPSPGSAEAMVDSFSVPVIDPNDPKKIVRYAAVRGLVRFDELASLIGRANRHGSAFKPTIMEFFDSYGDVSLHTRGSGRIVAHRPFCQVVATTQYGSIKDLLKQHDADSGFINRWVFAMGPAKRRVSYGGVELDLQPAVNSLRAAKAFAASGRRYELTDEALALWDEFFHDAIAPAQNDENPLILRVDLFLKKLILLFALNERRTQPDKDIVERVLTLWDYFLASFGVLGENIGVGEFEACRGDLIRVIREQTERTNIPPTARDLSRYMPKRYSRDMMMKALRVTIDLGEVDEQIVKPKVGRPTVRYTYVG